MLERHAMRRFVALAALAASACNGLSQSVECQRYLACVEVVMAGASAQYQGSYGERGTCWSTDQRSADQCTAACVQGRQTLGVGLGAGKAECQ